MTRPAHYKLAERDELTARQRQVLELVARGLTNAEIAVQLDLSLDGVKWHVREILGRLGVDSREEAADWWRSYNSRGSRARRLVHSVIPASVIVRAVGGGAFAAGVAGGGALFVMSLRGDGARSIGVEPGDIQSATQPAVTPTPTQTPEEGSLIIVPAGQCEPGRNFSTRSEERVEGGTVVLELFITKPRTCSFKHTYEAFVVGPNASFDSKRFASDAVDVSAPAGTDEIRLRIEWHNWCGNVPQPTPAIPPYAEGWGSPPPPLWVLEGPNTGGGSHGNYPPCQDTGSPTIISITATVLPDPPVAAPAASPAPPVASGADLAAFVHWFAEVVGARDTETLRSHAVALTHTCQGPGDQSLCRDKPAGAQVVGFTMDADGHIGSDSAFFGQLNHASLRSNSAMVAAGCAEDAAMCERFVIAFDTAPGTSDGPPLGSYQAFVFEVLQGKPALRGYYPGGADRDVVINGGVAATPVGEVLFAPVLP